MAVSVMRLLSWIFSTTILISTVYTFYHWGPHTARTPEVLEAQRVRCAWGWDLQHLFDRAHSAAHSIPYTYQAFISRDRAVQYALEHGLCHPNIDYRTLPRDHMSASCDCLPRLGETGFVWMIMFMQCCYLLFWFVWWRVAKTVWQTIFWFFAVAQYRNVAYSKPDIMASNAFANRMGMRMTAKSKWVDNTNNPHGEVALLRKKLLNSAVEAFWSKHHRPVVDVTGRVTRYTDANREKVECVCVTDEMNSAYAWGPDSNWVPPGDEVGSYDAPVIMCDADYYYSTAQLAAIFNSHGGILITLNLSDDGELHDFQGGKYAATESGLIMQLPGTPFYNHGFHRWRETGCLGGPMGACAYKRIRFTGLDEDAPYRAYFIMPVETVSSNTLLKDIYVGSAAAQGLICPSNGPWFWVEEDRIFQIDKGIVARVATSILGGDDGPGLNLTTVLLENKNKLFGEDHMHHCVYMNAARRYNEMSWDKPYSLDYARRWLLAHRHRAWRHVATAWSHLRYGIIVRPFEAKALKTLRRGVPRNLSQAPGSPNLCPDSDWRRQFPSHRGAARADDGDDVNGAESAQDPTPRTDRPVEGTGRASDKSLRAGCVPDPLCEGVADATAGLRVGSPRLAPQSTTESASSVHFPGTRPNIQHVPRSHQGSDQGFHQDRGVTVPSRAGNQSRTTRGKRGRRTDRVGTIQGSQRPPFHGKGVEFGPEEFKVDETVGAAGSRGGLYAVRQQRTGFGPDDGTGICAPVPTLGL